MREFELPAVPAGLMRAIKAYGRLCADGAAEAERQRAAPAPDIEADAKRVTESLLPKPRKLWGTAADVDNNPALYTEGDTLSFGQRMYVLGRQQGRRDDREALHKADAQTIGAEGSAWSDFRRGVGPRPPGAR